ncbi:MAG: hypothetical protein L6416_01010 [Candidatus Omnitrophica bacterium]|nr:hypothetical protein [Candidatus Omnitrophota bacterium]
MLNEEGLITIGKEYPFPTNDRADIVLKDKYGRIIGVEIEVEVNDDENAGPIQAIKYRTDKSITNLRRFEKLSRQSAAGSGTHRIYDCARKFALDLSKILNALKNHLNTFSARQSYVTSSN